MNNYDQGYANQKAAQNDFDLWWQAHWEKEFWKWANFEQNQPDIKESGK